ncbi:hypothetical protein ACNKHW_11040 [Shigella flexneri]
MVDCEDRWSKILTAVLDLNKRLKGRVDMTMALGLSDIKAQMGGWCVAVLSLVTASNGWATRCDICRRLKTTEKLAVNPPSQPCSDAESRKRPAGVAAINKQTAACT